MMRRCPKCDELLWQRTFDGVSLEGCKSCGGTWFDARELEQILQDPNLLLTVENAFRRGEQLPMRPRATNLCPVCRKPLIAFRHPKIPTVPLKVAPNVTEFGRMKVSCRKFVTPFNLSRNPSLLPLKT